MGPSSMSPVHALKHVACQGHVSLSPHSTPFTSGAPLCLQGSSAEQSEAPSTLACRVGQLASGVAERTCTLRRGLAVCQCPCAPAAPSCVDAAARQRRGLYDCPYHVFPQQSWSAQHRSLLARCQPPTPRAWNQAARPWIERPPRPRPCPSPTAVAATYDATQRPGARRERNIHQQCRA